MYTKYSLPRIATLLFGALALGAQLVSAATTDLSSVPLANSRTVEVKPNLLFMIDDSGSMGWTHSPDDARAFRTKPGYKSSFCNGAYYDPNVVYLPPPQADGTPYPNSTFTNANNNAFIAGSGSTDLSSNFIAYDDTTSWSGGTDTAQAAYYYIYTGTATVKNYADTGSRFYLDCNRLASANPPPPFTLVRVSATSGPGGADERQNFANWYTYYRTRMQLMKSGVGIAFSGVDSKLRIGYMTINSSTYADTDSSFLTIRDFDATQKVNWYNKVYATQPTFSTPLRVALSKAGRLYGNTLGAPDPVQYSCQQNFTLLSTDGYWNGEAGKQLNGTTDIGNQDNTLAGAPRPKFDGGVAASSDTLADVAQYYYQTDLRTSSCNTGASGADVCANNVPAAKYEGGQAAPHQHMTTYTLGLGVNGTLAYHPDYVDRVGSAPAYDSIRSGITNWPTPLSGERTTVDDLWHAAVNGGGKYLSAQSVATLVEGVRGMVADAQVRTGAAASAATSTLEPVAGDNLAFTASYRTNFWDGDLEARTIDVSTGFLNETVEWSARAQLQTQVSAASDARAIYTFAPTATNKLRTFVPASFTAGEKLAWFDTTRLSQYSALTAAERADATADNLIKYLRGQPAFENNATNTLSKVFREREYALGDIINGKPVYVGAPPFTYDDTGYAAYKSAKASRPKTVYVAANDGMLHAFDATTGLANSGKERWAYVPQVVIANLWRLADTNYSGAHRYFTDGAPVVGDVYDGADWRTILVAGLNGGGPGYYALDVTDPTSPKALWEFTDPNMGSTYGNPLIAKLADGDWRVMFTSGYNNPDGKGILYVVNAITGALDFTITTGVGSNASPSGLAKISGFVANPLKNNTVTRVYGGDLEGNLWRFDVNNIYGAAGRDAFRLAELKIGGNAQPITTKPELGVVSNKPVVFVGTGRLLGKTDLTDTQQQTIYAIRDQLDTTAYGNPRSGGGCNFVEQTLININAAERRLSNNPVDFTADCGWYVDLNPGNTSPGERVNVDPVLQLGVLSIAGNIPTADNCSAGGYSWVYFIDFATGGTIPSTITPSHTGGLAGQKVGNSLVVGLNVYRLPDGKVVATATTSDDQRKTLGVPDSPSGGGSGRRISWRELLQ